MKKKKNNINFTDHYYQKWQKLKSSIIPLVKKTMIFEDNILVYILLIFLCINLLFSTIHNIIIIIFCKVVYLPILAYFVTSLY
jgi:hypothetical protein